MSEDKRIIKTKQNLKQSLIHLLSQHLFEEITIKQICEISQTSRVTFYSHYSDKYKLADNIICDMLEMAHIRYEKLQASCCATHSILNDLCNLLDSILQTYHSQHNFFQYVSSDKNPYLYASFSKHLLNYVFTELEKTTTHIRFKYPLRISCSFLTFGLLGFISECELQQYSPEQIQLCTKQLINDLIAQHILTQ